MDTIVAPITPMISSPIIVIRISGASAKDALRFMSTPSGAKVEEMVAGMMSLYKFKSAEDICDDVMAVYFKAPKSFTGEDVIEISFHGNPIIVRSALQSFYSIGFREAQAGEFSKRAFLNGKLDLTQAEAIQEMISAKTVKGVNLAYKQLNGTVRYELDKVRDKLIHFRANLEAALDFSEDGAGNDTASYITQTSTEIEEDVARLLAAYISLRTLREGVRVVIAGKPNVGKSSLLNMLLRHNRAIVSETAGTTRDYIAEDLHISDIPIKIIDTAGIRTSDDELEAGGIERSLEMVKDADIVLVLLDLGGYLDYQDSVVLKMTESKNRIIVGTKFDMYFEEDFILSDVNISTKTGKNIDRLIDLIKEKALLQDYNPNIDIATVTERHMHLLKKVADMLGNARRNAEVIPMDVITSEISRSVAMFEEITGENYSEQVLDIIFGSFCIGK